MTYINIYDENISRKGHFFKYNKNIYDGSNAAFSDECFRVSQ